MLVSSGKRFGLQGLKLEESEGFWLQVFGFRREGEVEAEGVSLQYRIYRNA